MATNVTHVTSRVCEDEELALLSAQFILPIFFLGVLNVFIIFGNMLVILAVLTSRKLRSVTNIFIGSLAFADLCVGLLVLPFSSPNEVLRKWHFGQIWCSMWLAVDVWLCTASIWNLCAISLDRYLAISRPFRYPALMTAPRAKVLACMTWLISFLICLPPLLGWKSEGAAATSATPTLRSTIVELLNTDIQTIESQRTVNASALTSYTHRGNATLYSAALDDVTYNTPALNTSDCLPDPDSWVVNCMLVNGRGYRIYSACGSFYIPMIIMGFFYWQIYRTAVKTTKNLHRGVMTSRMSSSQVTMRIHRGGGGSMHGDHAPGAKKKLKKTSATFPERRSDHTNPCYEQSGHHPFPVTKTVSLDSSSLVRLSSADSAHAQDPPPPQDTPGRPPAAAAPPGGGGLTDEPGSPAERRRLLTTDPRRSNGHSSPPHPARTGYHSNVHSPPPQRTRTCSAAHDKVQAFQRPSDDVNSYQDDRPAGRDHAGTQDQSVSPDTHSAHAHRQTLSNDSSAVGMATDTEPGRAGEDCRDRSNGSIQKEGGRRQTQANERTKRAQGKGGVTIMPRNRRPRSKTQEVMLLANDSGGASTLPAARRPVPSVNRTSKQRLKTINREAKAAKTVGIIVGCFIFCWFPFFTVYLYGAFCENCTHYLVDSIVLWLGYCNSALNPCIYALFSRDFRHAFQRLLCCRRQPPRPPLSLQRALAVAQMNSVRVQGSSNNSSESQ